MAQRLMLSLLFIFLPLLLSPQALSQDRFARCHQYDALITGSVDRHWPREFRDPNKWKAQLYQESLCKSDAVSPANAQGIAQVMPFHSDAARRFFGRFFDPFEPSDSIEYGAYYMSRKIKTWNRRGRTPEQAMKLAQASYNAGTGNILAAQRKCSNARLWGDIQPCLVLVTGRHSLETTTYVERIERWTKELDNATTVFKCGG